MFAPRFTNLTRSRPVLLLGAALLALTACQQANQAADRNAERDPAAAAALNDPIMVDPDLATQNRGNSALSGGGPAQGDLPGFASSPEEAATARAAALAQLGSPLSAAPSPASTRPTSRLDGALTMPALAAAAGIASPGCADQLSFTMAWAARLPAGLPIYPRGHAIMAAGSDTAGCKVRAVRFVTPVAVSDAIDFYYASARAAKLPTEHRREGSDEVVAGTSGGSTYAVSVRQRSDGLTEVDLLTAGL